MQFLENVNKNLLAPKAFYFCFYSAFGSMFPLIAVYFKGIGMNPIQTGLLIGVRPFVEFLSAPFWGQFADKWRKWKILMLLSLLSWIGFTLGLGFIWPTPYRCIQPYNHTQLELAEPYMLRMKRSVDVAVLHHRRDHSCLEGRRRSFYCYESIFIDCLNNYRIGDRNKVKRETKDYLRFALPTWKVVGISPVEVNKSDIGDKKIDIDIEDLARPSYSTAVYERSELEQLFVVLLIVIVIGEFFSAPAITLADAAVMSHVAGDPLIYGRQRLFGSTGWALAMFIVGMMLDHSTTFSNHPCRLQHFGERNYMICFAFFSILMALAFLTATQLRFPKDMSSQSDDFRSFGAQIVAKIKGGEQPASPPPEEPEEKPAEANNMEELQNENWMSRIERDMYNDDDREAFYDQPQIFVNRSEARHFDKQAWIETAQPLANLYHAAFLFVTWIMGFGVGFVFTFLFWHLQDLNGSPTLFGLASVINHISELFAYFFSDKLIRTMGYVRIIYVGLGANALRFLYVSWLTDPWWVLPFELIQGITHAAVWSAMCTYMYKATGGQRRSVAQSLLQAIHHNLGKGSGAIIGGIMVITMGSPIALRVYGIVCLVTLLLYMGLHYWKRYDNPMGEEVSVEHEVLEEAQLAPHGVPVSSISKSLSSQALQQQQPGGDPREDYGYGATLRPDSRPKPDDIQQQASSSPQPQSPQPQQYVDNIRQPGGQTQGDPTNKYGYVSRTAGYDQ